MTTVSNARGTGAAATAASAPADGRAGAGARVAFRVNGQAVSVTADANRTLLAVLRDELGLTGTKEGCGIGVCGACAVLVDGRLASSCLLLVPLVEGLDVQTIEGLGTEANPSTMQRAFVEHGGLQCGICTPGQVVAATALLAECANPSREEVRTWMAGNLCRCTGYAKIVEAVLGAAQAVAGQAPGTAP